VAKKRHGAHQTRDKPPIDNIPTPSYLSVNLDRPRFAPVRFASILPEMSRIPERRNLKSGRCGVVQSART
jgi:hypothetical protein